MSILGPDSLLAASITVEVAWPTDPGSGDAPTWTDITPWVRSLTISRGRQYELDRVEAGTLTAELKNDDGRFDPTNVTSPYYPYVLPLRQVRVRSFYDGLEYPLFWGYAERWPMRWESGVSGRTDMEAVDGFAVFAQRTLRSVVTEEQISQSAQVLYPMSEPSGSRTAGTIISGYSEATVTDSKYGGGTVTFGEESLTFDGSGAVKIAGGDGVTTGGVGSVLQLATRANGGPFVNTINGFSIEMWFKAGAVTASSIWTLYAQGTTYSSALLVQLRLIDSGDITFMVGNNSGGIFGFSTTPVGAVEPGEVYHLVATLNAARTTTSLYLNGELIDSDATSGTPFGDSGGWTQVGGIVSPTGRHAECAEDLTVAHLALYGLGLSAGQVADLYEAGSTGFAGERTDERLSRVLDYGDWPGGTGLATGNSTMAGTTISGRSLLDVVQEVAEAEDGNAYVSADGELVFRNRHSRYNQTTAAVFGDPPGVGELHYAPNSEFDYDTTRIFGRVTVTPPQAAQAVAQDATAMERYPGRELSESPAIDTAAEALDRADYRLARYKDPHLRMPALTVLPQRDAASWPAVLGLEFGDQVEVTRDPSGAPAITSTVLVEAVEHQVDSELWVTTFALSPADINAYWKLEDPTYGQIDQPDIKIAY